MASKRSSKKLDFAANESYRASALSYPFTAIVGQSEMKLALITNAIDPLIGGVLVMGHRGTGKSTAVRAMADLLPPIRIVESCSYNCDPEKPQCAECEAKASRSTKLKFRATQTPVVELPLGATEDRVTGTISIERAIKEGARTFEPGLLARVNRGFFYIDEVNLLEDHLVDLLLDVAATGWNRVEREGLSVVHPARFVLVGSGNPEEGDLRPQLLDRFGLSVEVSTDHNVASRVEIIERRDRFDSDPILFRQSFAREQDELRDKISRARRTLRSVAIPNHLLTKIAQLCIDLQIDGHRGELTIMRAARALAAFDGRTIVEEADIRQVTPMALRHRMRKSALDETSSNEQINREIEKSLSNERASELTAREESSSNPSGNPIDSVIHAPELLSKDLPSPAAVKDTSSLDSVFEEHDRHRNDGRSKSTRKSSVVKSTVMNSLRGRHSRSTKAKPGNHPQVALAATVLAALKRGQVNDGIAADDLRFKLFSRKKGALFIFAIDASGSMGQNRIAIAKRVIMDRLERSYIDRDAVAIVHFRGDAASIALPPTRSILRARRVLDSLPVGGATPLSSGLVKTLDLVESVGQTHGEVVLLLFTDGRGNVSLTRSDSQNRTQTILFELKKVALALQRTRARIVVVDTKFDFESTVDTKRLAEILHSQWVRIRQGI